MNYKSTYNGYIEIVNLALENSLEKHCDTDKSIYDAMKYSLMAGGKRLRPILALATVDMLGGKVQDVIPYACAIEMIHSYSLIHDDLPSMDNDDLRRGKATNHKVFGEAMAILAGDALLNKSFEIMLDNIKQIDENVYKKIKAMKLIAKASGVKGMIGGQVIDLESENKIIELPILEEMHRKKTGALISAPVEAAGIISGANDAQLRSLRNFALNLGLAFQIKDDILDVVGTSDKLGKNVGSDHIKKKSTYVSIFGIEKSKEMLYEVTEKAYKALDAFDSRGEFLRTLTLEFSKRDC